MTVSAGRFTAAVLGDFSAYCATVSQPTAIDTPSFSQWFCQLRLHVCVGEWSRWPRSCVVYIYRQVTWPQVPWKLHTCSMKVAPGVSCREVPGVPTCYCWEMRGPDWRRAEGQVVQMCVFVLERRACVRRLAWTYSCRPVRRNGRRPSPSATSDSVLLYHCGVCW